MSTMPSNIVDQARICTQLWDTFHRAVDLGHTDVAARFYKRWRKATLKLLQITNPIAIQNQVEEFRDTLRSAEFGPADISFSATDTSIEIKGTFDYNALFKRFVM